MSLHQAICQALFISVCHNVRRCVGKNCLKEVKFGSTLQGYLQAVEAREFNVMRNS